jgi:hypothetical protein
MGRAIGTTKGMAMGWFSSNNPQTGDGKTKRDIYDKPKVTFRRPDGTKAKKVPKPKKK